MVSSFGKFLVNNPGGRHRADTRTAWRELRERLPQDQFDELWERRDELRFHHNTDKEMILVDKDLHEAFRHTGSASILRNLKSLAFMMTAPGLHDIDQCVKEDPKNALEISDAEIIGTGVVDTARWFDPFFEDLYFLMQHVGGPKSAKY